MPVNLTGGLLGLLVFFSAIQPPVFFVVINTQSTNAALISALASVVLLIASAPVGFLMNQLWHSIYNVFFDIHRKIIPPPRIFTITVREYKRAHFKELLLALLHRQTDNTFSDNSLDWHRNRLGDVHTNGTLLLSIAFWVIISMVAIYLNVSDLLYPNLSTYMASRWWVLGLLAIFSVSAIYRIVRAYRMLVAFNQLSLLLTIGKAVLPKDIMFGCVADIVISAHLEVEADAS